MFVTENDGMESNETMQSLKSHELLSAYQTDKFSHQQADLVVTPH